ncbi:hypothetical protein LCGC14_0347850 [marine sediment metagenome]|uniref:Uncharacterized protein n=1 Tax=marine sediment metagenome TaxID=412755 RepID=A0A0F9WJR3_9ZZZZ
MKICIISPIDYLEELSVHTNSQMMLAHLVLKSLKYRNFYRAMVERGDFIMMDNSFHELREALPTLELVKAVESIGRVDVMVAPDVWPKRTETEILTKMFLDEPRVQRLRSEGTRIMYVAHGGTIEAFSLAAHFCKAQDLDYIGLSSENASSGGLSRAEATRAILKEGFEGDIHWLGIGQPVMAVIQAACSVGVASIDGSSPIKIATRGYPFDFRGSVKPTMDLEQGEYTESMIIRSKVIISQMKQIVLAKGISSKAQTEHEKVLNNPSQCGRGDPH